MKILTICSSGMGENAILKLKIENILKQFHLIATIELADAVNAVTEQADFYVMTPACSAMMDYYQCIGARIIVIQDVLDPIEIEAKLKPLLQEL
ncbi:MAG: hypothetical protein ACRCY4_08265 [Brevinema sp.]